MTQRTLVVAPSWVGDMVMAQPLLALLVERDMQVDVLALPWVQAVVKRMPHIASVLDMSVGHGRLAIGVRHRIGRSLRSRNYRQAIVLPNTLKSALIPWFAGIRRRIGFHGESRYVLLNDRRQLDTSVMPLLVQRYYSLGLESGQGLPETINNPQLQASPQGLSDTLQALNIELPDRNFIALCPGAEFGKAKRWPIEHYAAVASYVLASGKAVWLFGSQNDREVTGRINVLTGGRCLNLAGLTGLEQAIDLLSLAEAVVTNDSGLMHIACALQRRVIALFGSTSPEYTPPLSDTANILRLGLPCSPCFERRCPLGHLDCLQKILPERVIRLLESGAG